MTLLRNAIHSSTKYWHSSRNTHKVVEERRASSGSSSYRTEQKKEAMSNKLKVAVIGSGNWGSTVSRIIARNVKSHSFFHDHVKLYVHESVVQNRKLSDIINEDRVNVKYLSGYTFPPNIKAIPDVVEAAKGCDILVFVVPHQYVEETCIPLIGRVKKNAIGISLIKGIASKNDGSLLLISELIQNMLGIEMSVLMGANLAKEIAAEQFSETTVGCSNNESGYLFKQLFHTEYFRVTLCNDVPTVELCGALKNIVACGVGFADGLGCGENTKAAVIRLGLQEMIKFIKHFYPSSKLSTYLESCGVADLVTSCYGGRNRKVSEALVNSGKSMEQLEIELLKGQKLQGPQTAETVVKVLEKQRLKKYFPLFVTIHEICTGQVAANELLNTLRKYPDFISLEV